MATRTRSALRQETRKYLDILPNDDVLNYVFAITTQGSHTSASTVTIQANTPEGKALGAFTNLKVRVTNAFQGVQSTSVGTAGTGYTSVPTVTFSAPQLAGGVTATGIAVLSTTTVGSITITNPGSGYTTAPTITFTGGGGINAAATATLATTIATATNATIAAGTGTVVMDTVTATKELNLQSNSAGLFTLTCTDATAEAFQLRLSPGFSNPIADYTPVLTVVHQ